MVRFSQKFTGDLWGQFQKRNASTCQAARVEESEAVPGGERACGRSVWASGGARPRPPAPLRNAGELGEKSRTARVIVSIESFSRGDLRIFKEGEEGASKEENI